MNVRRVVITIIDEERSSIMDEYVILLILAYFKNYGQNYSLNDLKSSIGVSLWQLDEYIDSLIEEGLLVINDDKLLALSLRGRLKLASSDMEYYEYADSSECLDNRWPLEKAFPVKGFSKKKWRGVKK